MLEHLPVERFEFRLPVNRPAHRLLDLTLHVFSRTADETIHDLGFAEGPTEGVEDPRFGANSKSLTVHQDAVAVEDDQIEATHRGDSMIAEHPGPDAHAVPLVTFVRNASIASR